jgi:hypothetical protein
MGALQRKKKERQEKKKNKTTAMTKFENALLSTIRKEKGKRKKKMKEIRTSNDWQAYCTKNSPVFTLSLSLPLSLR